jgi:hypothetical protein
VSQEAFDEVIDRMHGEAVCRGCGIEGVLSNAPGPLVLHGIDFSQLSAASPALPGEIITVIATGLGPTNPGVDPGQPFFRAATR